MVPSLFHLCRSTFFDSRHISCFFKPQSLPQNMSVMAMLSTISSSVMVLLDSVFPPLMLPLLLSMLLFSSAWWQALQATSAQSYVCTPTPLQHLSDFVQTLIVFVLRTEQSKHQRKMDGAELGQTENDLKQWLSSIDQLKP